MDDAGRRKEVATQEKIHKTILAECKDEHLAMRMSAECAHNGTKTTAMILKVCLAFFRREWIFYAGI